MTSRRNQPHDIKAAAAQTAQLIQQHLTCENCAFLPKRVRPMCVNENSPHYRRPRDTHNDACNAYAVKSHQVTKTAAPEPQPASRAAIAGEVAKRKHNRWKEASA